MATSFDSVIRVIKTFKAPEAPFPADVLPDEYVIVGLAGMSIDIHKDYLLDEINRVVDPSLTTKEVYLAGLYALRAYSIQYTADMNEKAIGFRTISFAVTGMIDRVKAAQKVTEWCEAEIARALPSFMSPSGSAEEMLIEDC